MQAALFFFIFLKKKPLKSIDFSESACIFVLSKRSNGAAHKMTTT
jgi:hypothetical protein